MAAPRRTEHPADRLAEVPLFKGLPGDALSRIVSLARTAEMAAGACFFNEGEAADAFFVLTGGRVKLTQLTPEGHQVVLRIIGPGDAFGGVGAFGEPVYPISAEAVEESVALRWTSPSMRRLLESEPAVALNALRFVSGRLHDLQRRYRQLMTERVERRIARALVRLAREAGRLRRGGHGDRLPDFTAGRRRDDRHDTLHRQPAAQLMGTAGAHPERTSAHRPQETSGARRHRRRSAVEGTPALGTSRPDLEAVLQIPLR